MHKMSIFSPYKILSFIFLIIPIMYMQKKLFIIWLAILQINAAHRYHYNNFGDKPHPTSFYKCFRSQGFSDISLVFSSVEYVDDSITDIYNAKNAGLQVSVAFFSCPAWGVENEVQSIIKIFGSQIISRFWIIPQINNRLDDPVCGLDTISPSESCKYLQDLIRVFKNKKLDAHILADQNYWIDLFHQIEGCPQLGNTLLWWDEQLNDNQNFEGYIKFGGWDKPYMKTLRSKDSVCGQDFFVNYYEQKI